MSSWIKNNAIDADKQQNGQGFGLKVAGSSSGPKQDEGVGVVMSMDKDEATRRQERDAEAAAKRQQNALPAWHLKSTITGDLTALGIQENARLMVTSGTLVPSSNDDTLKGLGTIGAHRAPQVTPSAVEVVKPEVDNESDCKFFTVSNHFRNRAAHSTDYDQYYASLAASNAASAQATPCAFASELGEEEEQKPNIQYLDSLNEYSKRSRSVEDEGTAVKKLAKVGSEPPDPIAKISSEANGSSDDPFVLGMSLGVVSFRIATNPTSVNGIPKPFSQVTEDDQEMMTPDEYMAYFEVFQARS